MTHQGWKLGVLRIWSRAGVSRAGFIWGERHFAREAGAVLLKLFGGTSIVNSEDLLQLLRNEGPEPGHPHVSS